MANKLKWDKMTLEQLGGREKELILQANCNLQGAEDDEAMGYDDWYVPRDIAKDQFRKDEASKRFIKIKNGKK